MKNFIISFLAAMALAGCGGDPVVPEVDPTDGRDTMGLAGDSPYIMFSLRQGSEGLAWLHEKSRQTRALDDKAIEASMPASIAVWGYNNGYGQLANGHGEIFRNQEMYYIHGPKYRAVKDNLGLGNWDATNEWPYTPQRPWVPGLSYRFFAYAPYTQITANQPEDSIYVPAPSFEAFKHVIWRHLPKYSTNDYMITDRIVQYDAHEAPNTKPVLALKHLYSRLRFCFKLGSKFGDRRVIEIKRVELVDLHRLTVMVTADFNPTDEEILDEDGNLLYAVGEMVPTLTHSMELNTTTFESQTLNNEPDELHEPIKSITISADYNRRAALDPSLPAYQPLASVYVYPYDNLGGFRLRITYDVYDVEGQLLRQDDTSTNSILVNMLSASAERDGDPTKRYLEAGYYYNVNITVEPEYLYVLSDNDFDADGFIVVTPN